MGCLLSLCDKLDTVAGCFAVGLIPSGSKDPLALRRAGQGIVRILWERGWAFTPADLIAAALRVVGAKATKTRGRDHRGPAGLLQRTAWPTSWSWPGTRALCGARHWLQVGQTWWT